MRVWYNWRELLDRGGCVCILLAFSSAAFSSQPSVKKAKPLPETAEVDFAREIRPLLADKCFACHGKDEKARQGNLRLDLRDFALAKTASGRAAIVPGKPDASNLIARITAKTPLQMPPAHTGKKLMPAEISLLKKWIAQGAKYAPHWAFIKPVRPSVPVIQGKGKREKGKAEKTNLRTLHPIDAFILARLEKEGLQPSPEADRYTLLRRVALDLTGLPPTPQEVDAFIRDKSPNAYEKVVDRLLASPHFGEKWARMWLDLARYADSAGYGSDPLRPNIWPYRDWVINALNRNLPYDQFTREQIAGDLLPNPTQEQRIATAFHRNTMTNTEGGTDDEEFRVAAVKDRATTTMQVWMGLTLGCAQCHTHKFDPITQKEYYGFFAFFNQTEDFDQPDERPTLPLMTEEQKGRTVVLKTEIAELEAKVKVLPPGPSPDSERGEPVSQETLKAELEKKKQELADIKPVPLPILQEAPKEKQRETHVLTLGNFLQKEEKVEAATPAAFPGLPRNAPRNRLGVAEWLVSRDNPLTARVAVNRFWAQLFGKGIVETEEDFGLQGALPTHPELLDWLALEFMSPTPLAPLPEGKGELLAASKQQNAPFPSAEGAGGRGWNIKRLLKTMVMSATYRQSSQTTKAHLEKDPRNALLARYPRRRLEAETVRDQALALSGLLSHKIGGPSVYPPQPEGLWRAAFNGERTWPTSTGEDRYRRGLYTFWRRTVPYPSMATFDAPSREICTLRRQPTNTPLQALVTLNDPAYVEMAQALGRRIAREGGTTAASRLRYALRLATGRPAKEAQIMALRALYEQEVAAFRAQPEAAHKLATDPLGSLPEGMDTAEMAAWTVVGNVLLNLDSVMTNY